MDIKSKMPSAIVAINHSTWNSDQVTNEFWGAGWCPGQLRPGVDDRRARQRRGFFEGAGTTPSSYNSGDGEVHVHPPATRATTILVDTSFGASAMSDSWSNQTAAVLNNHITNGVIGVNIANNPPVELPDADHAGSRRS